MIRNIASALLLAVSIAAAGPAIKIDNTTFDGGSKILDKDTLVNAEFKYYNTGSEPLRISNVRVSCGCTVVSYDTIVAPGKYGVLKPIVNLKGMRPGAMSRTVTINSNAANTPSLTLTISATIIAPVEVAEHAVHFGQAPKETITLTSLKKDLRVTGVVFKPSQQGGGPQWSASMPLNVNYKLIPEAKELDNGMASYKLELENPGNGKEPLFGEVVISTNHPDRKDITLRVRGHH